MFQPAYNDDYYVIIPIIPEKKLLMGNIPEEEYTFCTTRRDGLKPLNFYEETYLETTFNHT